MSLCAVFSRGGCSARGERDVSAALSHVRLLAFGFANPWLLWGLALGTIPILIHLLHRRTYRETDWAAMRFLLEASRKNSRRMRLEQLILLAVRTLLLLFAVLAFAEPLVHAVSPQARARTLLQRVIVIDASFSMGAKSDNRNTVRSGEEGGSTNRVGFAGRRRVQFLRIAAHSPGGRSRAGLRAKCRPFRNRPSAIDRRTGRSEADACRSRTGPGRLARPCDEGSHLYQRFSTFHLGRRLRGTDRPARRVQEARRRPGLSSSTSATGTRITRPSHHWRRASPCRSPIGPPDSRAGIRNFGSANAGGGALWSCTSTVIWLDFKRSTFRPVKRPSSNSRTSSTPSGEHAVEVRLPADRLAADNRRWLSVPVAPRMSILVVNGREGGRPAENASYYVQTVLAPSTSRVSGAGRRSPKVINEADLASEDFSNSTASSSATWPSFTPTEADLLQAYAEAGGGIVFSLGTGSNRTTTTPYSIATAKVSCRRCSKVRSAMPATRCMAATRSTPRT